MVTLSDFQRFEAIEAELRQFLTDKCNEYDEATAYYIEDYYKDRDIEKLDCWEFQGDKIVIWFNSESRNTEFYTYELPLDILFDPDFKQKMIARVKEEREKERLMLAEKIKRSMDEKRYGEIKTLHELMEKYPDEVKKVL